jgi:L-fuconolactonase
MMARIIDAHQHFWRTAAQDQPWRKAAHAELERDFSPEDLHSDLDAAGVDATVLMQSVDEWAENDRLAAYAHDERVAGVVYWLPIRSGPPALAQLSAREPPKLSGVRCLIADDPLEWLNERASVDLFRAVAERDLAWDVVPITSAQIQSVLKLARQLPDLKIVIDHLGRPPLETLEWEPWASQVRELAGRPNIAMKVSVGIDALTAWPSWKAASLERYVTFVYEQFGAERLMLASNWPVVLLRASYGRAWADLSVLVDRCLTGPGERTEVLGGTAERWYALDHRIAHVADKEALTRENC